MGIALRFVGQPGQFVAGVPAADMEVVTRAEAEELIASGLYERADAPADRRPRKTATRARAAPVTGSEEAAPDEPADGEE